MIIVSQRLIVVALPITCAVYITLHLLHPVSKASLLRDVNSFASWKLQLSSTAAGISEVEATTLAASPLTSQTMHTSNENAAAAHQAKVATERGKPRPRKLSANVSYVTGILGIGRLGNDMFMYAAVFAAARRHNLTPAFCPIGKTRDHFLNAQSLFRITAELYDDTCNADRTIQDSGFAIYNAAVEQRENFGRITRIQEYLECFKYFQGYEKAIKSEFALTEQYAHLADGYLRQLAAGRHDITFVGLHIRRGDMVNTNWAMPAPITFIVKAMNYFTEHYGHTSPVQFVVASNDLEWTYAALGENWNGSNIAYPKDSANGDMSILSRCNHSIVTLGSFGWWAAWLAGGEVIYFRDFIPPTSSIISEYKAEDYYPSTWIAMT